MPREMPYVGMSRIGLYRYSECANPESTLRREVKHMAKTIKKESTMDLLNLRDSEVVVKGPIKSLEIKKIVTWDNTNGQQGVMKASYINLVINGEKHVASLIIGSKGPNLWVGKRKTTVKKAEISVVNV